MVEPFDLVFLLLRKYAKDIIRNVNKCFLEQREKSILNMEAVKFCYRFKTVLARY